MKKLIIAAVIVAAGAYFGTKWKLHRDVAASVDMVALMMSPYAVVQYDGVSSTLSGELTIDGIRARIKGFNDEIFIDRLGIDTPSFLSLMKLRDARNLAQSPADILPKYFGIIAEGIRMPVNADYGREIHEQRISALGVDDANEPAIECTGRYGLSPAALTAMGYSEQVMSVSARFRQLGNRYAVELESNIEDRWDVDAELILVGDMMNEFAKGVRYRPRMGEMRIEYTDRSLQDRIVKYCKRRGLTDEEISAAQLAALKFFGQENGIVFDEYVIEPYKQFLAGKSKFIVTANPTEPVSLSQIKLYKPSDVPALLDLSAEAL